MAEEIVNRVANSPLVTVNLEDFYPEGDRVVYDIKDQLFMGLVLREKDFREFIKTHDWEQYRNKYVAVTCSADAIVPTWAYMLVAQKLSGIAKSFVFGELKDLEQSLFQKALSEFDASEFEDKPVVVK
ncbi:MAG: DUF2480 family protein, partial [Bacteroidota bacterium]|nr:DUF2480 family protein [Bacteroidota bacterium]MDX5431673.1 DUF2480 family protein [Bacteroidota bacterium]MDX5470389.1 DUF2480 family protein [Bacteroidota bacterium]